MYIDIIYEEPALGKLQRPAHRTVMRQVRRRALNGWKEKLRKL